MVGCPGGGGFECDDLSMEEFVMRKRNFHEKVAGFPSII